MHSTGAFIDGLRSNIPGESWGFSRLVFGRVIFASVVAVVPIRDQRLR